MADRAKQFPTWLPLLLILIVGLALRLVFRAYLQNPDSFAYILGASRLNRVGMAPFLADLVNIYENRVSIIFPLAWSLRLFGISAYSIALFPLFTSLLTIVMAYWLSERLFNRRAALITAALMATVPLDVYYATAIVPDTFIPFYTTATLLAFSYGQTHQQARYYILAGFCLFCAFQARATSGVLLMPLALTAWWVPRRTWQALLLPGLALFSFIILLWSLFYLFSGDFLLQLRLFAADASVEKYADTDLFLRHLKSTIGRFNPNFALLYYLAFPAAIYSAYQARRQPAFRLPLLTFIGLYLYFEFGSTSLTEYHPIWKLDRYLTILSVPAVLLVGAAVDKLYTTLRPLPKILLFAFLMGHFIFALLIPFFFTSLMTGGPERYNETFQRLTERLESYQVETIAVISPRWSLRSDVYAQMDGHLYQYQLLENVPLSDIQPGTIVIYDPLFFRPDSERPADESLFPAFTGLPDSPPDNWQHLFTDNHTGSPQATIYVYQVNPP